MRLALPVYNHKLQFTTVECVFTNKIMVNESLIVEFSRNPVHLKLYGYLFLWISMACHRSLLKLNVKIHYPWINARLWYICFVILICFVYLFVFCLCFGIFYFFFWGGGSNGRVLNTQTTVHSLGEREGVNKIC